MQPETQLQTPSAATQYTQPVQAAYQPPMLSNSLQLKVRITELFITDGARLVCQAFLPGNSLKGNVLKENLDVFFDQARTQPYFQIRERKVVGLSQTFDITSSNEQLLASVQHNGIASFFIESWAVLDANGSNIGSVKQGIIGGLVARFGGLRAFFPQTYTLTVNGQTIAQYKERGGVHHFTVHINFLSNFANSQYTLLALAVAYILGNRRISGGENGPPGI